MENISTRKFTFPHKQLDSEEGIKKMIAYSLDSVVLDIKKKCDYFKSIEIDFAVFIPGTDEPFFTDNVSESNKELFSRNRPFTDDLQWLAAANREVYVVTFCKIK